MAVVRATLLPLLLATVVMAQTSSRVISESTQVRLNVVKVNQNADGVELEIGAIGQLSPHPSMLQNPERLVLDFPNAIVRENRRIMVKKDGIESVRVAQNSVRPPRVRLVVDLSSTHRYKLMSQRGELVVRLWPLVATRSRPLNRQSSPAKIAGIGLKPIEAVATLSSVPVQPIPEVNGLWHATPVGCLGQIESQAPSIQTLPCLGLAPQDIGELKSAANDNGQLPSAPQNSGITLLDALRATLENQPLISLQQEQVAINRGVNLQAAAPFDTVVQSGIAESHSNTPLSSLQAALLGLHTQNQVSGLTNYTFSVAKLFRNGVSIAPTYDISRNADNTINPVQNTSKLSFGVLIPLLRGRGSNALAAATERQAAIEVDASRLDLDQLIAQLLADTAANYWNTVAAAKMLAIAVDAEKRGAVYVDNVHALIAADHVPRSDLNNVLANLATRTVNRIAAQQQFVVAQQQLALAMGISPRQMLTMSSPVDGFPVPDYQSLPPDTPAALNFYLEQALQHRADFQAARRRIDKAHVLRLAARNSLLPQVNFNFGTGYSGLQEGGAFNHFFASSTSGLGGADALLGLAYSFPVGNSDARGQMVQAGAIERKNELQALQLERTISSSVVVAVEGVRNGILQVQSAQRSVESSSAALDGERERYRVGMASVVDVLSVEDRLTTALNNQVQAQLSYAVALVQYRLATGTISLSDQPQGIDLQDFITLPFNSTVVNH